MASSTSPPRWLVKATEPVANAIAGRRWFPIWAVMRHTGRRSGTAYETPIAVIPTRDRTQVLIGLPWGPDTNWARNVIAAGGATMRWKGRDVVVTDPRVVDDRVAASLARGGLIGRVVRSGRFPAFLLLDAPTG